jgi:hypothetical protein
MPQPATRAAPAEQVKQLVEAPLNPFVLLVVVVVWLLPVLVHALPRV